MVDKLKILDEFIKNNPVGRQNPLYRHKVIEHKHQILKEFDTQVITDSYTKIHNADMKAREVIRNENEHSRMYEHELKKYRMLKELSTKSKDLDRDTPLTNQEVLTAMKELHQQATMRMLPESLVKNAPNAYVNMLAKGIPSEEDAENSAKCLKESLVNLVEILNFERFSDVTLEELKSRITLQSWKNYLLSFRSYINSNVVMANEIVVPTEESLPEFVKIAELYKNMNNDEKETLHEFEIIENSLKQGDFVSVYKILRNNDKFLRYIVGGVEHLQTLEDYLLYQTLKEINYLQSVKPLATS